MSGFLRRTLGALGNGLKPSLREFLRARAHFRAPLPAGPLIDAMYWPGMRPLIEEALEA